MDEKGFKKFDSGAFTHFTNPALVVKDLQTLRGIIQGILADSIIRDDEYLGLFNWMHEKRNFEERQPYKDIFAQLRDAIDDSILTKTELQDIEWLCTQYLYNQKYYTPLASIQQHLHGVIKGIAMDGKLEPGEISFLWDKMQEYNELEVHWPFSDVFSFVKNILKVGMITNDDEQELLMFFSTISQSQPNEENKVLIQTLNKNETTTSLIEFHSKIFCITGISKIMDRKDMAKAIESKGGIVATNVSKKLNYLVVCADKNSSWAYSSFGRKIEETMKLRSSGLQIDIVHEADVLRLF